MIKILNGIISPANEEMGMSESLTVFIDVDDTQWAVGGLDSNWTREEIQAHLNSREDEIKADIVAHSPVSLIKRLDLSDPPQSMHVAALKSVDVATKKATVVRKWMGTNYETSGCYVSLGALEAYQAGKLKVFNPAYPITDPQNADCFVLVYFISETPYDTAMEIPVIIDKVVK